MLYKKGLAGKLDALFSLYIKLRDRWTCRRCHKKQPPKSKGYHCAHIHERGGMSTRWDEENAFGMCYGCHKFLDERATSRKKAWYVEQFGLDAWDKLERKARQIRKFKPWEIRELIFYYNEKVAQYKQP